MSARLLALPVCLALGACVQETGPSEPYAFVGSWDCGVETFTFTNTTYNNGGDDLSDRKRGEERQQLHAALLERLCHRPWSGHRDGLDLGFGTVRRPVQLRPREVAFVRTPNRLTSRPTPSGETT